MAASTINKHKFIIDGADGKTKVRNSYIKYNHINICQIEKIK